MLLEIQVAVDAGNRIRILTGLLKQDVFHNPGVHLLQGIRTLTGNIVLEMGYATGLHREALIATGVVLFVFILIINFSVALLKRGAYHE